MLCPMRKITREDTQMRSDSYQYFEDKIHTEEFQPCLGNECAWWNYLRQECALCFGTLGERVAQER